ncbi:MAG: ABC transporter permease [Clostridiales bacterium]|nr:ABC transporter permease [Clostridiales bacterium]
MNKKILFGLIRAVILLLLILIVIVCSFYINKYSVGKSEFHWSIDLDKDTSVVEGIPFKTIDKTFSELDANFYSREKISITSQYGSTRANLYGSDENFFRFNKYPLITGSYFLKSDMEDYERYIVIGKSITKDLFNSTDVIGKEIEISKKKFTIIGVIEDEDLLIVNPFYDVEKVAVISNDIFVNIFSEHKIVHGEVRSDINLERKALENIMADEGLMINNLEVSDALNYKTQFSMTIKIVFFIMGVFIIIELVKLMVNEYKQFIKNFKLFNTKHYIHQWRCLNEYNVRSSFLKLMSLIVLSLLIYKVISFEFYIDVYYDGSYSIESIGDFYRWFIKEFSSGNSPYATSINEMIYFLSRIRVIGLLAFLAVYLQSYFKTVSWIKKQLIQKNLRYLKKTINS